jgi:hypothetical protein
LAQTVAELKTAIQQGSENYLSELKLSGPNWEKKPASGEGEDAWCARQVAEHIGGACGYFAAGIARVIGTTPPPATAAQLADENAAVAHIPGALATLLGVVDQIKDEQLAIETEFGPLGKSTLARIVGICGYHFNDHAGQLKALRGG